VVLNRGARPQIFRGTRALTCSTTWKVFERECLPSKHYASANLRRYMLFGLVPAEIEAGVKFLEIFQAEFELASQGRNYGDCLVSMPIPFSSNICALLAFENSLVHIEFYGSRLHRRVARLIPGEHECIPLHSSTQRMIPLWLSVIRRAFCNVAVHLHDTNFLQYCRQVLLWCDDVYLWNSTALEPHTCWMWH